MAEVEKDFYEIVKELKNGLDEISNKFLELTSKIERRQVELEEKKSLNKGKNKIVLDIGGQQFATYEENLSQCETSIFYSMLQSKEWIPEEDGSYFIDRNPKGFQIILDFLRGQILDLSNLSEKQKLQLTQDCQFYQIKIPHAQNKEIFFQNNQKSALILTGYQCNKGTLFTQGQHTWRVKLIKVVQSCDVGVVSPTHVSHFNVPDYKTAWGIRENNTITQFGATMSNSGVPQDCNFKDGDILTLHLDLQNQTLLFDKNGVQLDIIINNVIAPVQVAFSGGTGAEAEILE